MDLAQAVDQVRPSIVQISFHASDFPTEMWRQLGRPFIHVPIGTGFFVNSDGFVITARHVVCDVAQLMERFRAAGSKQLFVGLAVPNTEKMRGNFNLVDFDLVDEDTLHDLALLKLRKNPFKGEVGPMFGNLPQFFGTAILNPNRPKDGAAVGISGYPLGQAVLVTSAGWMATSWAFEIREVPVPKASELFYIPHIVDSYLADVEINPGNSGAPVYLIENGTVIGICVGSKLAPVRDQHGNPVSVKGKQLHYSSGLTVVVPSHYVIDLLQKHNLNWSERT